MLGDYSTPPTISGLKLITRYRQPHPQDILDLIEYMEKIRQQHVFDRKPE
jgi:hypothetical protein